MVIEWTNKRRRYKLLVQPNLFGGTDVICMWGSIGTNLGNYKVITVESENDIDIIISNVAKRRQRRGYTMCETSH
jgi:predicted DNA-binding WGR domain protein